MKRLFVLLALILCVTVSTSAARLWASGFELGSATAGVEWTVATGTPAISTATVRTGTYSGSIPSLSSGTAKAFRHLVHASSNLNGPYFVRVYVNFTTFPSAENSFLAFLGSSAARIARITVDNGGLLRLHDEDGQIGSASSALSTGTQYAVEMEFNASGAGSTDIVRAKLDHTEFAGSATRNLSVGVNEIRLGGNLNLEAQTTAVWFFDDFALNDDTGSFQNSYPGSGKIIHLLPSAAGDINTFATQTGGTAGSSNNFTRVDEVTPDDATTLNGSSTLNEEDLFNVADSGIGASDTVNVVMIGGRFRNNTADATTTLKFEAMKTGGGTIAQGTAIVPNSTTWRTNAAIDPRNYSLVLHQDPDSANWTQTTLDSMQIGYKLTLLGVNRAEVTKVWALVDYTPGGGPPPPVMGRRPIIGIGALRWKAEDYRRLLYSDVWSRRN